MGSIFGTPGKIPDNRIHLLEGEDWAGDAGTDFWLIGGLSETTVAAAAGKHTLASHGWTATNITEYAGTAGTFLDSTDDDPSSFKFDSGGDLLNSPAIFGSYSHGLMASKILGYMPTTLSLEGRARLWRWVRSR